MLSEQIMADNEDETTYGRQVEEINEQIKHWSKYVLLLIIRCEWIELLITVTSMVFSLFWVTCEIFVL